MVTQVAGPEAGSPLVVAPTAPVSSAPLLIAGAAPIPTLVTEATPLPRGVPTLEETDVAGAPEPGPAGPPGPARGYRHVQTAAAASWPINHGLGLRIVPTLRLADAPDEPVFADVRFVDDDNVIIEWPEPVAGFADF